VAESAVLHAFCTQSPGGNAMPTRIKPKRYATLQTLLPPEGEDYPISPGISVQELLSQLNLPVDKAKLIFIDGRRADLLSKLNGGERVGIFPPVGGG
jgi:molybdopterin converting factor small subunit